MKNKLSIKFLALFSAIAVIATIGLTAPRAIAKDILFTGVVVKKNVAVRAGAGSRYYVVGHVSKGQEVKVKDVIFGWNKIAVPKSIFSYIKKSAVDKDNDKTTATVNTDNAKVTAANLKGAKKSYRQQVTLEKGAKVKIIGEEDDYYKIDAPEDAFVFLPPGSVRHKNKINKAQSGSTTEKNNSDNSASKDRTPSTQPQTPPATNTTAATAPTNTTPATSPTTQSSAVATTQPENKVNSPAKSNKLIKVENQMLPLFSKPISQQPLDKMKAAYKKVDSNTDLSKWDKKIIEVRLAMISRNQKIAATLSHIKQVSQQIKNNIKEESKNEKEKQLHYDIVGYLRVSKIYDGQGLPKLFRITDSEGSTLAYVTPQLIHSHQMLGRLVGIVGKKQYSQTLNLNVFKVKQIYILKNKNK